MAIPANVQAAINSCALTMQQKMRDNASATAWNRTLTIHTNNTATPGVVGTYYLAKLTRLCTLMTTNGCVAADVATLKTAWGA